jgi:2-haloacid dehalogenase
MKRIKALLFDTFGTVTDWHSTVVDEGKKISEKYGISVDWHSFANRWRDEGYMKAIFEFAKGTREWEPVDSIHYTKLISMIKELGFEDVIAAEDLESFNLLWHRLYVWEDVNEGLLKLKQRYSIAPFSNGDFALIANISRNAKLPWDYIVR